MVNNSTKYIAMHCTQSIVMKRFLSCFNKSQLSCLPHDNRLRITKKETNGPTNEVRIGLKVNSLLAFCQRVSMSQSTR